MFGMEQILSKCEQYFMRNGLKSTTMDDVCRFMGISKKTLYQFIDQKSGLGVQDGKGMDVVFFVILFRYADRLVSEQMLVQGWCTVFHRRSTVL